MANQYDPIAIKSGILTVLGTDSLRADRLAAAGLTITGPASGDACQVSGALTLGKAVNTSTSPIVGIFDGETNSVVRKGVVVATMKAGVTLANGDTVWLSSTAGALTNVKPTMDMLHEVGVVVDAASAKILLQQKPVLALPVTPPVYLFTAGSGRTLHKRRVIDAVYIDQVTLPSQGFGESLVWPTYDGTSIWLSSTSDPGFLWKINATTLAYSGPYYGNFRYGGCTFDGTYIWTASSFVNNHNVYKVNIADGTVAATYSYGGDHYVGGILCYDGVGSVWMQSTYSYTLYKMRISDGVITASVGLGVELTGMCSTKTHLWGGYDGGVKKILLSTAAVVGTYTNGWTWGGTPAYDGTRIYQAVGVDYMRVWNEADGSFVADVEAGSATSGNVSVVFDGTWLWMQHAFSLGPNYGWHKWLASDRSYIGTYIQDASANGHKHGCSTANILPNLPGT